MYGVYDDVVDFLENWSQHLVSRALFFNEIGQKLARFGAEEIEYWKLVGQFFYVITVFEKTTINLMSS